MADNLHNNLFDRNGQLTAAAIQQYVEGKLSPEARDQVEQYLQENEFEREAVEGLSDFGDKPRLPHVMAELHQRVEKKIGGSEGKVVRFNFRRVAAAAAVLVIAVVGFWYFSREDVADNQPVMAENIEKYPNVINTDSIISAIENLQVAAALEPKEEAAPAPPKKIEISASIENMQSIEWEALEVPDASLDISADLEESQPQELEQEPLREDMARNKAAAPEADMPAKTRSANSITIVEGQVKTAETLAQALNAYEEDKFSRALNLFDQVLQEDPNNTTAIFYSGLSHFQSGNYQKALSFLTRTGQQEQSPFYEAAQWHRALSFIRMDNPSSAKPILRAIASGGGEYAAEAKKMLEQIK